MRSKFKELKPIHKQAKVALKKVLKLEAKQGKSKGKEDNRDCYDILIEDGPIKPVTISDGTIVGYVAPRTIKKVKRKDCDEVGKFVYTNIYKQNNGNLLSPETPSKLGSGEGTETPSEAKRPCDFADAGAYFYNNSDAKEFKVAPLVWYVDSQTQGQAQQTTNTTTGQTVIQFERGEVPFLNPNRARTSILALLRGLNPNGIDAPAWQNIGTVNQVDSEGNTIQIQTQQRTQTQTQTTTTVRINIYTTLTTPSATNRPRMTNSQFMDQRLLQIGQVLVLRSGLNLQNANIRRGRRDGAVRGIIWNASSALRRDNPNYVILDIETVTTQTTVTRNIITSPNATPECP